MGNLLVVQDLRVTYGGVTAVDKVSLTVHEGEIVGLIGPNGAGKVVADRRADGLPPRGGGQVIFDGASITGARPYRIARRGLIRTFQSVELFDDLTVEENLLVAAEQPSPWSVLRDLVAPPRPRRNENVAWALDACGLDDVTGRLPSSAVARPPEAGRRGPGAGHAPPPGADGRARRRAGQRREHRVRRAGRRAARPRGQRAARRS